MMNKDFQICFLFIFFIVIFNTLVLRANRPDWFRLINSNICSKLETISSKLWYNPTGNDLYFCVDINF